MQSNRARATLVIAAVAIAVGALLVLRPSDEDEPPAKAGGQAAGDAAEAGPGVGAGGQPPRRAKPQVPTVTIVDGQPVGGVTEIEAERGETIEFLAESDVRDELHVHGYELTKEVAPNDPVRFEFEADLEGIYEVEAHEAGDVPVAELRVNP